MTRAPSDAARGRRKGASVTALSGRQRPSETNSATNRPARTAPTAAGTTGRVTSAGRTRKPARRSVRRLLVIPALDQAPAVEEVDLGGDLRLQTHLGEE